MHRIHHQHGRPRITTATSSGGTCCSEPTSTRARSPPRADSMMLESSASERCWRRRAEDVGESWRHRGVRWGYRQCAWDASAFALRDLRCDGSDQSASVACHSIIGPRAIAAIAAPGVTKLRQRPGRRS